ncbi:hypothetical protein Tco_0722105 [Tanacetum coccineum]
MITGRKEGSSKNTYSRLSGRGDNYPEEKLELYPKEETSSYYPKRDWDVLWENGDYKLIEQELSLLELEMGQNGISGTSLRSSIAAMERYNSIDCVKKRVEIDDSWKLGDEKYELEKYLSKIYGVGGGASCSQRKVSMVPFVFSIPFVLSWGGNISSHSFLPSILLLVVIIIMIVIVVVILIVVVVVIVGVVIVVAIIGVVVVVGGVSSILKLSFMIIGYLRRIVFYY